MDGSARNSSWSLTCPIHALVHVRTDDLICLPDDLVNTENTVYDFTSPVMELKKN